MGLIRYSITFSNNFPITGKRLIDLYKKGSFLDLLGLHIRMTTDSFLFLESRIILTYNYECECEV